MIVLGVDERETEIIAWRDGLVDCGVEQLGKKRESCCLATLHTHEMLKREEEEEVEFASMNNQERSKQKNKRTRTSPPTSNQNKSA